MLYINYLLVLHHNRSQGKSVVSFTILKEKSQKEVELIGPWFYKNGNTQTGRTWCLAFGFVLLHQNLQLSKLLFFKWLKTMTFSLDKNLLPDLNVECRHKGSYLHPSGNGHHSQDSLRESLGLNRPVHSRTERF